MKTVSKTLAVLALAIVLSPLARAADDEVPNINKRGDDEKAFVSKVANTIVKNARTSIKTSTLESFEKKTPKEGRTEFHIKAGYKGGVVGTKYTADIVVQVDTSDKEKWEVLRIDYSDNNKGLGFNRKNVDGLVSKFNGK
jgi:hypothetical protein